MKTLSSLTAEIRVLIRNVPTALSATIVTSLGAMDSSVEARNIAARRCILSRSESNTSKGTNSLCALVSLLLEDASESNIMDRFIVLEVYEREGDTIGFECSIKHPKGSTNATSHTTPASLRAVSDPTPKCGIRESKRSDHFFLLPIPIS